MTCQNQWTGHISAKSDQIFEQILNLINSLNIPIVHIQKEPSCCVI